MKVKIKRMRDDVTLPEYQTAGAAAMDVRAAITEKTTIHPNERLLVPGGFALELPMGYEAQIRARSGLSLKHGICLANGVGTIDSDYRGEVGVILINLDKEPFTIEPNMRVAQMIIARYEQIEWIESDVLGATDRGASGYGSTRL